MKTLVFSGALVLVVVLAFGCAGPMKLPSHIPLPSDITIEAPDPEVPKELVGFLGKWTGAWDGAPDIVLIVERVLPRGAQVIYARSGTNTGWWRRFAYIENGTLRMEFPEAQMTMWFSLTKGGVLDGRLERRGQRHSATLWKVEEFVKVPVVKEVATADPAIIQEIVNRSPWAGDWHAGSSGGNTSFEFYLKRGKIEGNFLGATGSALGHLTGPLRFVEFKQDKLTFETPSGAEYELRLVDGMMEGALYFRGAPPGTLVLRPVK